jgi:bacteriocin-like protein
MSKVHKAIASLAKFQENSDDVEQLTTEELSEIEGGTNISCQISNTSCKPKQE